MLSPQCKKGPADLKPVDPDEILCVKISQISNSVDYLELITPTSYKIQLKFLETELPSENGGVIEIVPSEDKLYHINSAYSLSSKNNIDMTDICNYPINAEFYKIFSPTKTIKIGQNNIRILNTIYDNLANFESKLEFLPTVPILNIKPVSFNYKIIYNKDKIDFGLFDNFMKMSFTINPTLADFKIGFLYPANEEFKKKIYVSSESNFQFIGFINEISRMLLLECAIKNQCISIELKMETKHYLGFLELNKLLNDEKDFNQNLPLFEFNWNAMKSKCCYNESIFSGHESIIVEKKKKTNDQKPKAKTKGKHTEPEIKPPLSGNTHVLQPILVPVLDEDQNQLSITIDISLKKQLILKELNSEWLESHLTNLVEDESEDEMSEEEINDIQSLILTENINPQQMKDKIISVILKLMARADIMDITGKSGDRPANLILLYFKLHQLITDSYEKFILPLQPDPERLDKNLLFMAKEFHFFDRPQQANLFYLRYMDEKEFSECSYLEYISYNLKILNFERVNLCLKRLLSINDSNVLGLLIKSYMNYKLNNFLLCEQIIFQILKLSPGFIHALVVLYLLQIKTEKHTHFNWIANEILKCEKQQRCPTHQFEINHSEFCWTSPNSCDTFFKSAIFFINVGCFTYAEIALSYNQLVQDNLKNDRSYLLSIIDFEQKNYNASLYHLQKYKLSHQTIYKFKFNLLYNSKNFDSCYEFYKDVVDGLLWTLPPYENRQFYLKLAWHFIDTNKFDEAKLYLDKIPQAYATYLYWIAQGKCLIGMGQFREAEHCFVNANVIDKLSKEPWLYLNQIYEQLNQLPQAAICKENFDKIN